MGSLPPLGLEQRLVGLHLHPELAFVIDRAARIDVVVALGRLGPILLRSLCFLALEGAGILLYERRRLPFVQRLRRLHIEVRITQRRGLARGMKPVAINQRMSLGLDDLNVLEADALQIGGHNFGGLAHIVFVLFRSADAGNAQQIFQLFQKALLVLAGIGNCGGNGCG